MDHEVQNRVDGAERMDSSIMKDLITVLDSNPYSQFFRSLKDVSSLEDCNIIIRSNIKVDQRLYNMPTVSQVAAIWVEESDAVGESQRDIRVYAKRGRSHYVQYYYSCYDPLQYPLLFPYGESGWHAGIPKLPKQVGPRTKSRQPTMQPTSVASIYMLFEREAQNNVVANKRDNVSCREYSAYHFQVRHKDEYIVLHSGRLFQQFIVDMYIKIETQRLDYFRTQQRDVRTECLQGLMDSISVGETKACNVGQRVILPTSFIGGRDMRRRYMDVMALVQRYGKPDIFLTITCNPNWPEMKELLKHSDEAQNRPDLIARVFRAKVEELKTEIIKKKKYLGLLMHTLT
ncbi:unnamed protein product [Cuscuta europaea]|uniref:Helitron helicase-like domain-containing protein n=1 Tax=Cuscuta europaea TaxID=41803 RepID=A0A9P0YGE0_CUSEU|nr:unnamed protein product [Cuscuta europaea]